MSDWEEVKLGEIAKINPTEKLSKGQIATKISMEHLQPFTKKPSGQSQEAFNGGMKFRNGDTLIARITPCLENGKTAYIDTLKDDEVGFGSTEYIVLREISKISDKQFLYYFSRSNVFRDVAIASMTGSSGRQRVQTDVVVNHLFNIAPLPEQQAIASVLSSLDDKIDLLHRQNKTLEAMAETLFRQWFIEEAKEDWEEVEVNNYAILNQSTLNKDYPYSQISYLDTGSLTKGLIQELQLFDLKEAPSRAKRLVKNNDILISTVRPNQCHYGIIDSPAENLVVSTGFCTVTANNISPYFLYFLLTSNDMTEYLHSVAEGSTSTYPSLKPSDIGAVKFNLPPREKLENFDSIASSNWAKIHANYKQIQTLENLRDTLLPKLMSGEIRVQH